MEKAAKPSRLWAIVEHEPNGGVYRSDDAGATWTFMSGDRNLRQRSWYYSKLYADPKDTNIVYAPNVSPMVSKDGGKTFAAPVVVTDPASKSADGLIYPRHQRAAKK